MVVTVEQTKNTGSLGTNHLQQMTMHDYVFQYCLPLYIFNLPEILGAALIQKIIYLHLKIYLIQEADHVVMIFWVVTVLMLVLPKADFGLYSRV